MSEERSAVAEILRTVPDEKAFYFYRAVDVPVGTSAKNLDEFVEQLKDVDPVSVEFHLERHDFQNWVLMLGDVSLAKQLSGLSRKGLTPAQLQSRVASVVQSRLEKLQSLVR